MVNDHVNCRTGVMKVSFKNIKVKLNIFHADNQPSKEDDASCHVVNAVSDTRELERAMKMDKVNMRVKDNRVNHSRLDFNEEFTKKVKNRVELNNDESIVQMNRGAIFPIIGAKRFEFRPP